MRGLKLLFTDKYYRWATLESLKLRMISLPAIRHIVSWYRALKMQMQGMNRWEQYVAMKNIENNSKEFSFTGALIRLQACIMAEGENKELFEKAKSAVLCNEIINEEKYKDFKEWLEGIDSSEKDYSRVQKLINVKVNMKLIKKFKIKLIEKFNIDLRLKW